MLFKIKPAAGGFFFQTPNINNNAFKIKPATGGFFLKHLFLKSSLPQADFLFKTPNINNNAFWLGKPMHYHA